MTPEERTTVIRSMLSLLPDYDDECAMIAEQIRQAENDALERCAALFEPPYEHFPHEASVIRSLKHKPVSSQGAIA